MATLSQDCMMLSKTISISEWTEEPILHMTLDANPACSLLQHFFSDTLREMPLCLAYWVAYSFPAVQHITPSNYLSTATVCPLLQIMFTWIQILKSIPLFSLLSEASLPTKSIIAQWMGFADEVTSVELWRKRRLSDGRFPERPCGCKFFLTLHLSYLHIQTFITVWPIF